jgi:hypothetical protein
MRPSTRLIWISVAILLSSFYGVLVLVAPETAAAVMLGYVGLLLSIFFACEVWKRHE